MKPSSLAAALAAAFGLALAVPAAAQDWKGQGRLEGRITDADGKPVADVLVRLDLPGRGGTQLKSDKKGKWAILGLASGQWNVDFEASGYTAKQIYVSVAQETRTPPVLVTLEKAAPKGPPPEILEAIKKGDEAYQAGRWVEARQEYEKLVALMADKPEVVTHLHMQIARCYSQEKNYAKELEHLQMLLDADPTNVEVRKLMALEAFNGGLFDKGLELMQGLDESALQDADILYNIAVAYFNSQKTDEAITYLTKALTVNPTYADGYFLRGNAYLGQNKLAEAKADYAKFVEVAPTDPRVEAVKKVVEQLE